MDAHAETRPPLPPFTLDSAREKVRRAEDAWNSRDPARVALAYTEDSRWRNRSEFFSGRAAITSFLEGKWARELDYRLIKDCGPSRTTRSPCGSSMSSTTPTGRGSAPMAMSNGPSTRPD